MSDDDVIQNKIKFGKFRRQISRLSSKKGIVISFRVTVLVSVVRIIEIEAGTTLSNQTAGLPMTFDRTV
jgi:hypothetical protein